MPESSKNEMIANAIGIAKWFSVDVTIKLFGRVIWSYHYPPQN